MNNDMGIKAKIEKRLDVDFAISFEENGSGDDLNNVIDDLCKKHRGDSSRQSPAEIFTEITQAVFDQGKNTVDDSKR